MLISNVFDKGCEYLAKQGLNLVAVLDCTAEPIVNLLGEQDSAYRCLILLGNGGPSFWRALQAQTNTHPNNPVDDFSRRLAVSFVEDYLQANVRVLYPGDSAVPLQQLGTLAAWHHPSPLGVGIHPYYGLWFAYRAAVLSDAPLTPTAAPQTTSPCAHCREQACLNACPASALALPGPPDVKRCLNWRIAPDSSCADTCLARLACPVGAGQRYDEAQIRYHYGRSLADLQRWRALKNGSRSCRNGCLVP